MQSDQACGALKFVSNSRLDSWKSIANYLGRGLRTVQRWHVDYGMPVHHFGAAKGSVFAYSDEIDQWLQNGGEQPITETRKTQAQCARANAMWELRSERNLASITALYREVIDEDPHSEQALIGLSRSLIASTLLDIADGFAIYPSALKALRCVPQGGGNEADIKCVAAWLHMVYERRWHRAKDAFGHALRMRPHDPFALSGQALLYITEEKLDEAFNCAWEAKIANPLAILSSFLPAWIEYLNGDNEGVLELTGAAKASGEYGGMNAAVEALALAYALPSAPNLAQIEKISAAYPQSRVLEGILGYSYGISARPGKAWEMLGNRMQTNKKRNSSSYALALILLGLGEEQEACMYLERAFAEGSLWSLGFRVDPLLRPLRGHPQFESLLRRIGPAQSHQSTSPGGEPESWMVYA